MSRIRKQVLLQDLLLLHDESNIESHVLLECSQALKNLAVCVCMLACNIETPDVNPIMSELFPIVKNL